MVSAKKSPNFLKFTPGKRKPLTLNRDSLVDFHLLAPGQPLPLVAEPRGVALNLPRWVEQNREDLRGKLSEHGALLFRNFRTLTIEAFQSTVRALSGDLLKYMERSSPRHAVKGEVYTSTDYPREEPIFLHNEQSYNLSWCGKISFFCRVAPKSGGQTPLADTRKILARLKPEIRESFFRKKYRYLRNFADGLGLPWQEAFQTRDKTEVEAYCRRNSISWEWHSGNRLRTWQVRRAIHKHPGTGAPVWFNHCTFFHVTTSPETIREKLIREFEDRDLPNQTFYGDGQPIEAEVLEHLRAAYLKEKVLFDWREGDILIVDNMLTSHGREPFSGSREILVAMSEATDSQSTRFEEGASDLTWISKT